MKQKVKEQRKIFKLRKVNSIIPKLFFVYDGGINASIIFPKINGFPQLFQDCFFKKYHE